MNLDDVELDMLGSCKKVNSASLDFWSLYDALIYKFS